jgi:hypothetical protein
MDTVADFSALCNEFTDALTESLRNADVVLNPR